MPTTLDDPTVVRSLAVHADDVVAALEAWEQGTRVVLRVTPPFNGRMRARIHRIRPQSSIEAGEGVGESHDAPAVHLPPTRFVDADAPAYPHADDTDPIDEREYDVEAHHDRHVAAVERWRERVRNHLADAVDIPTADGPHRVDVAVLG